MFSDLKISFYVFTLTKQRFLFYESMRLSKLLQYANWNMEFTLPPTNLVQRPCLIVSCPVFSFSYTNGTTLLFRVASVVVAVVQEIKTRKEIRKKISIQNIYLQLLTKVFDFPLCITTRIIKNAVCKKWNIVLDSRESEIKHNMFTKMPGIKKKQRQ